MGILSRYKCIYDDSSLCDTTILNINSIGNGSKQYRRNSAVYKDDFTVDGVAGNFVIQGVERRGVTNENETYCESQEIIEFNAKAKTKIVSKPIKKLKLPESSKVAGVIRDNVGIIPFGEFQVNAGDKVIVFCSSNEVFKMEKFFN